MTNDILLKLVQEQLTDYVMEWVIPEPNRLDGSLSIEQLLTAATQLKNVDGFYLVAITGIDDGAENNTLEILYHFCIKVMIVTLRVTLDRNQPTVPSLCTIFPYASPYERETGEMFGITFTSTPDTSRLFLPDDWTEGVYPLRKDAQLEGVNDVHDK